MPRLAQSFYRVQGQFDKILYRCRLRSAKNLCLPDFIGIGAQKAGTTWLYYNLSKHPDIFLPKLKEVHFFDRNFHESLRSYSSHFLDGVAKVKGEITPSYSILPVQRIKFIYTLMPNVRLIYLLRNPIERTWSHAIMNLVTIPQRRLETVSEAEFLQHFRSIRSVARSNYLQCLERWLSVFPAEQLYIGFFEEIQHRPRELLSEIFQHIGVTINIDWSNLPFQKVVLPRHKRPSERAVEPKISSRELSLDLSSQGNTNNIPEKYRVFLEDMYRQDIERLYTCFGVKVESWRC